MSSISSVGSSGGVSAANAADAARIRYLQAKIKEESVAIKELREDDSIDPEVRSKLIQLKMQLIEAYQAELERLQGKRMKVSLVDESEEGAAADAGNAVGRLADAGRTVAQTDAAEPVSSVDVHV